MRLILALSVFIGCFLVASQTLEAKHHRSRRFSIQINPIFVTPPPPPRHHYIEYHYYYPCCDNQDVYIYHYPYRHQHPHYYYP